MGSLSYGGGGAEPGGHGHLCLTVGLVDEGRAQGWSSLDSVSRRTFQLPKETQV